MPKAVLEAQSNVLNYKKHLLLHKSGIRQIILKRNKFGNGFAMKLHKILIADNYIKAIDVAGNKI
jgi:hypothetical protein